MADDNKKEETKMAAAKAPVEEKKMTTAERVDASKELAAEEREARETPADIAPATIGTSVDASGSIMEPEAKDAIPLDHPAVDNNPRAGTTEQQNQADFNDPTLSAEEAVKENLSKKS